MSTRTIRIGLCGLGTVGQGVWKHLSANRAELESRLGVKLELHRASVRNLKKRRAVKVPASRLTTDAMAIATDPKVDIVCELIGGTTLARKITRLGQQGAALRARCADSDGGAQGWRAFLFRSLGRWRYSDHQGAARGTRRESLPPDLRDPERHL
jgi:hypothetical protein